MNISVLDVLYEAIYSMRMLACILLFSEFTLERRSRHVLRVFAVCVPVVLLGAGFSPLVSAVKGGMTPLQINLLHIFWYTGFLAVFFGAMAAIYRGRLTQYTYAFACGALIECSMFGLFRLTYDFGIFQLRVNTPVSYLSEVLFSVLLCVGLYFFNRRMSKIFTADAPPFAVLIHLFAVALTMFLRLALQSVYERIYETSVSWIVNIALFAIPLFVSLLVVVISYAMQLNADRQALNRMLIERERQYKTSAENIELINRKCHDIKHRIRFLRFVDDEQKEREISDLMRSVSIYDSQVKTSSAALNTLLSEKSLYCTEHGVTLTNIIDGDALSFMNPVDLYVMFGNLLDNAVEAVMKIPEREKRIVSLVVEKKKGVLFVEMNNYYTGGIVLSKGLPVTSKADKRSHGFGVESAKRIAEKYGGKMEISAEEGIFVTIVHFPIA